MHQDNKRIVKNTLFLYGRMIFLTVINLYTVRITLDALGIEDYGIYNVIASFIALFSVLSSTLTSATQRFLSFHLGTKDYIAYSRTYSLLLICFGVIALVITIVAEILGMFAFDGFLNIPPDKIYAAKWVYQTSIVTFIIYLLTIPFTSSIVSNEKMSAFAYISILDGLARLGLVYILLSITSGRLILYGFLTLAEALLIFVCYVLYCKINFKYCKVSWIWDKVLFRELSSYTSWNLLGAFSGTLSTQGQNVILNIFFGPVINTAKGIADRIHNVIYSLSSNFYMAVSPQIVKSYASNDVSRMMDLGIRSSKLSFLLLYLISFPIICAMHPLLLIWLGSDGKTEDMVGFSQLALILGLITSLESPITHMIRATGQIKEYQIKVGVFTIMYIPLAWIVLKIGGTPLSSMWVLIILLAFVQIIRMEQAKKQIGLPIGTYIKSVIKPISIISILSIVIYYLIESIVLSNIYITAFIQLISGGCVSIALIITIGLTNSERHMIHSYLLRKLKLSSNNNRHIGDK